MSIVTKKGDTGMTALMYNRRLSKAHPRVEAYGGVDELSAALGVARATAERPAVGEQLLTVQKDLIKVMGELATDREDMDRYIQDGYDRVGPEATATIDGWIRELEAQTAAFRGWVIPGRSLHEAALNVARTVCRRAERRVCALNEQGEVLNAEIIIYLNRLSDWLWLRATSSATQLPPASPLLGPV